MTNPNGTPKPHYQTYTIGGLVRRIEKEEFSKPQTTYVFSNGATKVETDRTESGIYKR